MLDVLTALKQRQSIRAFLPKPVPQELIRCILDAARFAPSGTNTQPWQVAVVQGKTQQQIGAAYQAAHNQGQSPNPDYHYYPQNWFEPYKSRRFNCGMVLYQALKINREDKQRRQEVWNDNYRFFDAPVGLFILIDKRLEQGSWMDLGMFIQSILLAALGVGLASCAQAAMAEYPDIVRATLGLSNDVQVACGIALGYPNFDHPINQYRIEKLATDDFTQWYE